MLTSVGASSASGMTARLQPNSLETGGRNKGSVPMNTGARLTLVQRMQPSAARQAAGAAISRL